MLYDITKTQLLRRVQNDMVGIQWYFLVYLRVYTDESKKRYYSRRFVTYFSAEEVQEYLDVDSFSEKEFKEVKGEFIWSHADSICSQSKIENITEDCNYTIRRYNGKAA